MPVENFLSKNTKVRTVSLSAGETKKLGAQLAGRILTQSSIGRGVVIGLQGELGAGKTTFLQGFAHGLGIEEKITSPTFTIMKKFQISNSKSQTNPKSKIQNPKYEFKYFYHFDCYRIDQPTEILTLGWQEIINNPENIVAIEWPERIKSILPNSAHRLRFKFIDKNKREIKLPRP